MNLSFRNKRYLRMRLTPDEWEELDVAGYRLKQGGDCGDGRRWFTVRRGV